MITDAQGTCASHNLRPIATVRDCKNAFVELGLGAGPESSYVTTGGITGWCRTQYIPTHMIHAWCRCFNSGMARITAYQTVSTMQAGHHSNAHIACRAVHPNNSSCAILV